MTRRLHAINGLLLILTCCGGAMAQPAAMKISAPRVEAATGSEVAVPLSLKEANSVGAVHLELTYDPSMLEFRSVSKGALFSGNAMLDSNGNNPGRLIVGLVSLEPVQGDGVAATARFFVKGSAGGTSPLRLQNLRAWENKNHTEQLVQGEEGLLTVTAAAAGSGLSLQNQNLMPWLIAGGATVIALVMLIVMLKSRGSRQR
jgi:hypothetical protein